VAVPVVRARGAIHEVDEVITRWPIGPRPLLTFCARSSCHGVTPESMIATPTLPSNCPCAAAPLPLPFRCCQESSAAFGRSRVHAGDPDRAKR
jgi:hypothetical protein